MPSQGRGWLRRRQRNRGCWGPGALERVLRASRAAPRERCHARRWQGRPRAQRTTTTVAQRHAVTELPRERQQLHSRRPGGGRGGGGEGVHCLVEHYMAGDDDARSREIDATITLMGGGLAQKHTGRRTRGEFVCSGGGEVRVAKAPKDAKVTVIRAGIIESVGDDVVYG